jgi:hypothetical protein
MGFWRPKNKGFNHRGPRARTGKIKTQFPNPNFQISSKFETPMTEIFPLVKVWNLVLDICLFGLVLGIWNFNFLRALRLILSFSSERRWMACRNELKK